MSLFSSPDLAIISGVTGSSVYNLECELLGEGYKVTDFNSTWIIFLSNCKLVAVTSC